jgi:hypothetical protein
MDIKNEPSSSISISFISLKQSNYLKTTGSGYLLGQFLQQFDHSTNTEGFSYLIEGIQQNTPELKDRIHNFININSQVFPALNGFRTFLKLLPENHYFLIVNGKITDTASIMKYFEFLTKYHNERGMQQAIHEKAFDWEGTFEHYNMHTYGHQQRKTGGNTEKENRVCRFCFTINGGVNSNGSIVTFKNKSHAFSEALGNKMVVNLDECDACNDRFSRDIEPSLINYVTVFRSLYGLKGKGGTKKLIGENFVLDPKKGFDIKYDGIIDPETRLENIKTDLNVRESFIPQNIYRCLVKFVLSVIDEKDMIRFTKTLDWVNSKFDAQILPRISFVQAGSFYTEQPMLYFFQRKDESKLPYMIGEFHYADMVFVFIIPFCTDDEKAYTSASEYEAYWKEFNKVRLFHDWIMKDLSSTDPVKIVINVSIEGINLGENAFITYKDEKEI